MGHTCFLSKFFLLLSWSKLKRQTRVLKVIRYATIPFLHLKHLFSIWRVVKSFFTLCFDDVSVTWKERHLTVNLKVYRYCNLCKTNYGTKVDSLFTEYIREGTIFIERSPWWVPIPKLRNLLLATKPCFLSVINEYII